MAIASLSRRALLLTLICLLLSLHSVKGVQGADAMYTFGDSYIDTGNANSSIEPLLWGPPYGMTWPGYPDGRFSNGRVQTDYMAQKFNLSSPIPIQQVNSTSNITQGINFAVSGAGVTYAWGRPTVHMQVDEFEALVNAGNISKDHLAKSVAFINVGLNDYCSYHGEVDGIPASMDLIIDGLTYNIWRIGRLGIKNVMVTNIVPLACGPWVTYVNNFTSCTKNETFIMETRRHDELLEKALYTLQEAIPDMHVLLLNQTRAMNYLLSSPLSGFINTTVPCCHGWGEEGQWQCGWTRENGDPLYQVCSNPNETFWWDQGHPSDAGAKALIDLYWSVVGFTRFGRNIESWDKRYNI